MRPHALVLVGTWLAVPIPNVISRRDLTREPWSCMVPSPTTRCDVTRSSSRPHGHALGTGQRRNASTIKRSSVHSAPCVATAAATAACAMAGFQPSAASAALASVWRIAASSRLGRCSTDSARVLGGVPRVAATGARARTPATSAAPPRVASAVPTWAARGPVAPAACAPSQRSAPRASGSPGRWTSSRSAVPEILSVPA